MAHVKKGRNPLFNKTKKKAIQYMDEDDSDTDTLTIKPIKNVQERQEPQDQTFDSPMEIIENCGDTIFHEKISLQKLLKISNFRDIVKRFHNNFKDGEVEEKDLLEFFFEIYMEKPTSRRCPDANLEALTFQQPELSIEEKLLIMNTFDLKPCAVSMSRSNPLYSIEKRLYKDLGMGNPVTKDYLEFIDTDCFSKVTLQYFNLIFPNILLMFDYHNKITDKKCRDRDVEKLVETLFDQLQKESSERLMQRDVSIDQSIGENSEQMESLATNEVIPPEKDVESTLVMHVIQNLRKDKPETKKPQRGAKSVTAVPKSVALQRKASSTQRPVLLQKEAIFYAEIKNYLKQCTPDTIIERYIRDQKFSVDIKLQTSTGCRILTLQGNDICTLLNIPLSIWQTLTSMMCQIDDNMKLNTDYSRMIKNFAKIMSYFMKTMKPTGVNRYYTVWNWDIRSEHHILVQKS
ncbi:hypothetical protein DMENIID0001_107410 [Sergentomyia squamirostris]